MLTSFIEWAKVKELNEGVSRLFQRDVDLGAEPQVRDTIITNPDVLVSKLQNSESGYLSLNTEKDLDVLMATKIQDDTVNVVSLGDGDKYKLKLNSSYFRDISDAFMSQGRVLVYVGSDTSYDKFLMRWAPKPQGPDVQQLNVMGALEKDDEDKTGVKALLRGAASDEKTKLYQRMAAKAQNGEDVTRYFKDELDRYIVQDIYKAEAGAIIDQLHQKGYPVPGENPPANMPDPLDTSQQTKPADLDSIFQMPGQAAAISQGRNKKTPDQERATQKFNALKLAHHDHLGYGKWKMFQEEKQYSKYIT